MTNINRLRFLYYRITFFLYDSSKILLVEILNYKDVILPPIEVKSLEEIAFFDALVLKFSAFSFFFSLPILHLSAICECSSLVTIPTSLSTLAQLMLCS